MSKRKHWVAVCGGALFGLISSGFGHSTGHESRNMHSANVFRLLSDNTAFSA